VPINDKRSRRLVAVPPACMDALPSLVTPNNMGANGHDAYSVPLAN
jgi:hypothetical protein